MKLMKLGICEGGHDATVFFFIITKFFYILDDDNFTIIKALQVLYQEVFRFLSLLSQLITNLSFTCIIPFPSLHLIQSMAS